ncbi:GIY-YIG nuclease family protein [Alteromonas pelagimontana]|uniref:GIY-YIG nuclease family protein n=1 Tax=Alteromonas pelagimontana TaxID=1858656 RepID=UPI001E42616A|nr:GIY-YIG nuclease family protein [Alteromonas pelagimontana]
MQQSITVPLKKEDTKPWFVYLIENRLGQLYTGITTDPCRRIRQHRGDIGGGAKSLRGKAPLLFKKVLRVENRATASSLEYEIKALDRKQKEALIAGTKTLSAPCSDVTSAFTG